MQKERIIADWDREGVILDKVKTKSHQRLHGRGTTWVQSSFVKRMGSIWKIEGQG